MTLDILAFHRILGKGERYFIPPMTLEVGNFIDLLKYVRQKFRVIDLNKDIERVLCKSARGRYLALTFDDGYLDNFIIARPILKKMGLPATFFVPIEPIEGSGLYWWDYLYFLVKRFKGLFYTWLRARTRESTFKVSLATGINDTGDVEIFARKLVRSLNSFPENKRKKFLNDVRLEFGEYEGSRLLMNWEEVKKLKREGFAIGSHSVTHTPLTDLSREGVKREIYNSKAILTGKIRDEVKGFCYPRGAWTQEIAAIVKQAGYTYAVTTRYGSNNSNSKIFSLYRRGVPEYQDLRSRWPLLMYKVELSGALDFLLKSRR